MLSSRTSERWAAIAVLALLFSQFPLLSWPVRAAVEPEALLQPTPLVLKDGRIANVSIHVLSFDTGNGQLAGNVASRLSDLTATVATDCFLTAQVIGHVSSHEVAENDTLAAHRLARARADAVQASLIGGGLPAKAIASVWDWQFLVREPRATLWVFRLVQGEDCEGLPLDGSAALVAQDDARQVEQAAPALAAEEPPVREAARAQAVEPTRSASPSRLPQRAAPTPDTSSSASAPAAERAVAPAPDAVPPLTRRLPALSPSSADERLGGAAKDRASERSVAAVEPAPAAAAAGSQRAPAGDAAQGKPGASMQQSAAVQDPERQGKVEWGADNVEITFATNSSYFPPGTARRLRALLDDLAAGDSYRVQIEVGVSGSDTVVGATSPEEARQYNRWLAERRMGRVREWLDENASDRQLQIEPAFQPDDNSRRVVVRIAPIS